MLSDKYFREKKGSWNCLPHISTGKAANKELSEKLLNGVMQPRFNLRLRISYLFLFPAVKTTLRQRIFYNVNKLVLS